MAIETISYATGPRRRQMPFTLLHMTIWLTVISLGFIFLGCVVLPRFDLIFKDFKTGLPPLTEVVLTLSRWCSDDFGWIALLLLPAVPMTIDQLNGRHWAKDGVSRRARILFGFFILMGVLACVLAIYSVFLPMVSTMGGVSSPKPSPH